MITTSFREWVQLKEANAKLNQTPTGRRSAQINMDTGQVIPSKATYTTADTPATQPAVPQPTQATTVGGAQPAPTPPAPALNADGTDQYNRVVDQAKYKAFYQQQRAQQQAQATKPAADPREIKNKAISQLSTWLDQHPEVLSGDVNTVLQHPVMKRFYSAYGTGIQQSIQQMIQNKLRYKAATGG